MTGRIIFSIVIITIVLSVVCLFFILLFKLLCCNRRSSKKSHDHKSKMQNNKLMNEQLYKMHLNNFKLIENSVDTHTHSSQQSTINKFCTCYYCEISDNVDKKQECSIKDNESLKKKQKLKDSDSKNKTELSDTKVNFDDYYHAIPYPSIFHLNKNLNSLTSPTLAPSTTNTANTDKTSTNNQNTQKSKLKKYHTDSEPNNKKFLKVNFFDETNSNTKTIKFKHRSKFSRWLSNFMQPHSHSKNTGKQQNFSQYNSFIDPNMNNEKVLFMCNQNNRRLSVITEEKTSALSSRCGSTERTNAIV